MKYTTILVTTMVTLLYVLSYTQQHKEPITVALQQHS